MLIKIWKLLHWVVCWRDTGKDMKGSPKDPWMNNIRISFSEASWFKDLNQEVLGDSLTTGFKIHCSANELWSSQKSPNQTCLGFVLGRKSSVDKTGCRALKITTPIFKVHRSERWRAWRRSQSVCWSAPWQRASQCSLSAGHRSELYRHLDLVFKCRCFFLCPV